MLSHFGQLEDRLIFDFANAISYVRFFKLSGKTGIFQTGDLFELAAMLESRGFPKLNL